MRSCANPVDRPTEKAGTKFFSVHKLSALLNMLRVLHASVWVNIVRFGDDSTQSFLRHFYLLGSAFSTFFTAPTTKTIYKGFNL